MTGWWTRHPDVLGFLLGIFLGYLFLAYVVFSRIPCPVCAQPLRRGVRECPRCFTELLW